MLTNSTTMAAEEDEISLYSDESSSSSSEESEATSEDGDSIKDPTEDARESCWRQLVFASICVLGCTVIFTTVVLMLSEDNQHFEASVSLLAEQVLTASFLVPFSSVLVPFSSAPNLSLKTLPPAYGTQ